MGDRLTWEESDGQTETPSYGDIFDELFPHYLVMGMTPEQYWDGESWLKKAYRKAYRIRNENQQKVTDWMNWNQGIYLRDALQSVALFVGGLNTKGVTMPEYPDKPRLVKAEEMKREEDRKKHEEDQQRLAMAMFQAAISQFNRNVEKRLERDAGTAGTGQ